MNISEEYLHNALYATARDGQVPPKGNWHNWDLAGGRGSGKTWALAQWVKSIANLHKNILILSPNISARHLAHEYFLNTPGIEYNKKNRSIYFSAYNSSALILQNGDRADRVRGHRFGALAVDDVPDLDWELRYGVPNVQPFQEDHITVFVNRFRLPKAFDSVNTELMTRANR